MLGGHRRSSDPTGRTGGRRRVRRPPAWSGGEWRNYGRDLTNSRNQSDEKILHATELLQLGAAWSHIGGVFNNTPIVADGCVYLADTSGDVSAHNADTGEQLWSRKLNTQPAAFGGGLIATPAIHGNTLFVIVNQFGSPYLAALDRTTVHHFPAGRLSSTHSHGR